jgi:hypothetical protein
LLPVLAPMAGLGWVIRNLGEIGVAAGSLLENSALRILERAGRSKSAKSFGRSKRQNGV